MMKKTEAEGGCGVIGLASAEKIKGKHLLPPLTQMRNRGNGKGGGIAAAGLSPEAFGVSADVLEKDYLLAIAYLDLKCREEIEKNFIHPLFEIDHVHTMSHLPFLKGLEITPPHALVYFVRVKPEAVQAFTKPHNLPNMTGSAIEDELVYQNSYKLNHTFYASTGDKRAFVLSHGKNLLVLKMVGYGDDVVRYYQLEDFPAHVWIGHHRYPTKGRVWHPGGAHPFIGLHEALVHNGDFANYASICEYLAQRNIHPLFLTDTEVSVLMFDLLHRVYQYPLEYVMEALAPTTERDFTLLPTEKQHIYQMLQKTHMHGSPDGPWFFLLAQSLHQSYSLIGITDTSMLRPQVFALQKGSVPIGFSASEKQAIDACLLSLSNEDSRFWPEADFYWSARGGSYTDGGAFVFTVQPQPNGKAKLSCTDKFGTPIHEQSLNPPGTAHKTKEMKGIVLPDLSSHDLYSWIKGKIRSYDYQETNEILAALKASTQDDHTAARALDVLTLLIDGHYPLEKMRKSYLNALLNQTLEELVEKISTLHLDSYIGFKHGDPLHQLKGHKQTVLLNAKGFPAEGEGSLAITIVELYKRGFKKFKIFHTHGQRFIGNGLGPKSQGVKIDVYGSSGDYLASGIDGADIIVHGSGQDQLAQIMKEGTLVVHGDIGQTFMYGAKGGHAFIKGSAAGRPLINAVGHPKVVINGTCLDYLAESFMAGDPLRGGGFVVINGISFNEEGEIIDLENPYPGSNLFSLASGGCIYIRDPHHKVSKDQLNGGEFAEISTQDADLILPFLEENAALFEIPVERLLSVDGQVLPFHQVYRKIAPAHVRILQEEEAWVKKKDDK